MPEGYIHSYSAHSTLVSQSSLSPRLGSPSQGAVAQSQLSSMTSHSVATSATQASSHSSEQQLGSAAQIKPMHEPQVDASFAPAVQGVCEQGEVGSESILQQV